MGVPLSFPRSSLAFCSLSKLTFAHLSLDVGSRFAHVLPMFCSVVLFGAVILALAAKLVGLLDGSHRYGAAVNVLEDDLGLAQRHRGHEVVARAVPLPRQWN